MSEHPAGDDAQDGVTAAGEHGHPGTPALYAEMLPLVEAGATVEQAARRFGGDSDEVGEIAEGFLRWRESEGAGATTDAVDLMQALARAEERVGALEQENRVLRRRLADLRDLIRRAQDVAEGGA